MTSTERLILELAAMIGKHWRDQQGVNSSWLDQLAHSTRGYSVDDATRVDAENSAPDIVGAARAYRDAHMSGDYIERAKVHVMLIKSVEAAELAAHLTSDALKIATLNAALDEIERLAADSASVDAQLIGALSKKLRGPR